MLLGAWRLAVSDSRYKKLKMITKYADRLILSSFTEYDRGFTVWKLDVRGLGRDVIIGIICVLRAASSSTFLRTDLDIVLVSTINYFESPSCCWANQFAQFVGWGGESRRLQAWLL